MYNTSENQALGLKEIVYVLSFLSGVLLGCKGIGMWL